LSQFPKLLKNFTSQHLKKIIVEKTTKERLQLELKMTPSTQKDCLLANALHLPLREVVMVNIDFCQEML
jgi:hypothetical protein